MPAMNSMEWTRALRATIDSYRRMIDATLTQLTDEELHRRPADNLNSVAVLLRHLGGNLQSRWTDFLTSDGEKPNRNRDAEFCDWEGDRQSLIEYFDAGWSALLAAIETIEVEGLDHRIRIRGESHSIPDAVLRSLTHVSYHIGQLVMVARMVHEGDWNWLTIPPGQSAEFNSQTWGSSASRAVFANKKRPE